MDGLSYKQRAFVNEYLKDFNATQAAIRAGYSEKTAYSIGQENLKKPEIATEIKRRVDELTMKADEVLIKLSEQARSDIGVFFKIVEEWTFYPLPTYEVIDAKEVVDDSDPDNPRTRISYWVRHAVVDMEKVIDPRYSHLLAEFRDSPKDGIVIKPYSKQAALQTIAKMRGAVVDKVELSGPNGGPIPVKHDLTKLSDEELAQLEALRRKMQ